MIQSVTTLIVLCGLLVGCFSAPSFEISNDTFLKDGVPFKIIAANIHYFRIPPSYWEDRLLRLLAMGVNAIEVYIPWNFHNENQDQYNFEGNANVDAFLSLTKKLGLVVLLRPGPYICAEWEFGGLPGWLFSLSPPVTIRTYDPTYIAQVTKWWSVLLPKLVPHLYSNGGSIVMSQVENEYGFYGNVAGNPMDKKYMETLVQLSRQYLGNSVILYTTDPPSVVSRGTLPGDAVYTVVDFGVGTNLQQAFEIQKQYNPAGKSPRLCSEFYSGWLTHYGERMANTSSAQFASSLDQLLSYNASVSIYMGHGGTNFGFWNGANWGGNPGVYQPTITSYDYDAPVSEDGDHGYGPDGDKFEAVRKVLQKFHSSPLPNEPPFNPKTAYGNINLSNAIPLFSTLPTLCPHTVVSNAIETMEKYDQNYGFILYSIPVPESNSGDNVLQITEVHDRAHVFLNTTQVGIIYRVNPQPLKVAGGNGKQLNILVENMGRINFGGEMQTDKKGITQQVTWNNKAITGQWKVCNLPLTPKQVSTLNFNQKAERFNQPTFYKGVLTINRATDTYVSVIGWTKGVIWINGNNIGRYWNAGPQRALYVPAGFLNQGANDIIVLELDNPKSDFVLTFTDKPDFSP